MQVLKYSPVVEKLVVFCFWLMILFVVSGSGAGIASAEQQKMVGKAKFSSDYFNFGIIPEGQVVSHAFELENVGNAELKILRAVAACGCTAVSSSNEAIAPGAKAAIKVDFNSSGFSGKLKKVVRVYSNDYENPEKLLSMEGEVQSQYQVLPSLIYFENILSGSENQSRDFTLQIRKNSGKFFKTVKSYSPYLSVQQLSADTLSPDSQFMVDSFRVTVDSKAPMGELRDRILVEISDGKQSSFINLPVLARISGALSLEPQQVSFGLIQGSSLIERQVKLLNKSKEDIEVYSVSSDSKAVSTKIVTVTPGKEFLLSVILDPQKVSSDLRALVGIKTSSPGSPDLLLSVFGVVPPAID